MKKLIFVFAIVALSTIGAKAQDRDDAKSTNLSIGVNIGAPTSSPSIYSLAWGVDLQAGFPVASGTQITASAGYEDFSVKSKYGGGNSGFIPLLGGVKFNFGEKAYGHAQLGYGISTAKGGGGAFAYAPSIGYYFSPNFDGSVKYLAFSKNSVTVGTIGIRLAYNF
ncbi:MAG: hypothetical protein KGM16_13485 [Bacteroidota bacterium]|nr:hypothetical protein [Bacteroidota bacterium]